MSQPPPLPRHEQAVLDEYVTFLRGSCNCSRRTVIARRDYIARRMREWTLDGFSDHTILEYLSDMSERVEEEETSPWTAATYSAHLRNFSAWAAAAGYIALDPTRNVRPMRRPDSLPRPLSDAEVGLVLSVAAGDVREWLFLGLHMGLRAHEIVGVRSQHVRVEGLRVKGKGQKVAMLPIHPRIAELVARHAEDDYWYPGNDHGHIPSGVVSRKVGALFGAIGIEGSSHRCRHTFGTNLARAGVHVTKIQELMRHSSLATTQAYVKVVHNDLADAVALLPDYGAA